MMKALWLLTPICHDGSKVPQPPTAKGKRSKRKEKRRI